MELRILANYPTGRVRGITLSVYNKPGHSCCVISRVICSYVRQYDQPEIMDPHFPVWSITSKRRTTRNAQSFKYVLPGIEQVMRQQGDTMKTTMTC